jgi:hypothetical protein
MNNLEAYLNGFLKAAAAQPGMPPAGASTVPPPNVGPAGPQPQQPAMPPMQQGGMSPLQVPPPQGNPAMQKFMQLMQQYQQQGGGPKPAPQAVQPIHINS